MNTYTGSFEDLMDELHTLERKRLNGDCRRLDRSKICEGNAKLIKELHTRRNHEDIVHMSKQREKYGIKGQSMRR